MVRCPACGFKTTKVHETRRVEVKDIPLGRPNDLVWLQRRFECPNCAPFAEVVSEASRQASPACGVRAEASGHAPDMELLLIVLIVLLVLGVIGVPVIRRPRRRL